MDKPERPADRMMVVLACPWLDHAQARVVAVVAFHDGSGGARLGLRRIAREAGFGDAKRNVENLLKAAREAGAIDWQAGTGKAPNSYTVPYAALRNSEPPLWRAQRATTESAPQSLVARSAAASGALSAPKPELTGRAPGSAFAVQCTAKAEAEPGALPIGETESEAAREPATRGSGHGHARDLHEPSEKRKPAWQADLPIGEEDTMQATEPEPVERWTGEPRDLETLQTVEPASMADAELDLEADHYARQLRSKAPITLESSAWWERNAAIRQERERREQARSDAQITELQKAQRARKAAGRRYAHADLPTHLIDDRLRAPILDALRSIGQPVSGAELAKRLGGSRAKLEATMRAMLADGTLVRSGRGLPGSPYRYSLPMKASA